MTGKTYDPVGTCIYCGATKYGLERKRLGDEHIVAFALNGRHVLPEASCKSCEVRTGGLEQQLLGQHGTYRAARAHARARSRRGPADKVYDTLPLFVGPSGQSVRIDVPFPDAPAFVYEIALPPPGLLVGRGDAFPEGKVKLTIHQLNPAAKFPLDTPVFSPGINAARALRLPAKIAHAFATAELGLGTFAPLLTGYILDKAPVTVPWDLIGGVAPQPVGGDYDLALEIVEIGGRRMVAVDVQLLPQLKMPRWQVVVGEIA